MTGLRNPFRKGMRLRNMCNFLENKLSFIFQTIELQVQDDRSPPTLSLLSPPCQQGPRSATIRHQVKMFFLIV